MAWALDEAGLSVADLASRAKVTPAVVEAWIKETERPGKTEFAKIVDAVRRPSAIFYMPAPPVQAALPAAFRRAPGPEHHATAAQARREVRKARRIQKVMSWLLESDREHLDLPTLDPGRTTPIQAGQLLRARIGVTLNEQADWANESFALREWRSIFDDLNILTFSLQLGKDDVRGFSVWDARAPIVAVNTAYNEYARIFTMAHELGHLVSRSESVCYGWVGPEDQENTALERWCEKFAASFLLPPDELRVYLSANFGITPFNPVVTFERVIRIARKLKVSARALTLSLIDVQLAPRSLYREVDKRAKVVDRPRESEGGGGGRPTAEKRLRQYGPRVSQAMTEAVASGVLPAWDAADFLDVSLGDLQDISEAVLGRGR
ncbi:ImmA/IrrE family metallo-endopeptidase [Lentzea atacamensis]|uniref:ImmA/IrrE family metallo-endopeptidase n=1 Tax=Lentzea atacamensis TaxID=531938 RepID=UPI001474F0D3|nr:ImmA/IrrE family metallo-endopeptidase [Lentzea atacamensis]